MDLDGLTPGDVLVVELTAVNDAGTEALAEREGTVITVTNPDGSVGEWVEVEVTSIDVESNAITATADDRPGLDEQYSHGDTLTVSVDRVKDGHAFVDIEPGRTLKIDGYPYRHSNIDVVVRKSKPDFLRCERYHCIDRLSMAALTNTTHHYPCLVEFADTLRPEEMNVFISHALASNDRIRLKRLLRWFPDTERVEFSTATSLLSELDTISPGIWRDILYTVACHYGSFIPSIGVEYLAATLVSGGVPLAWKDSVLGNLALLLEADDVDIRHTTLTIPEGSQQHATVREGARHIQTRVTETRNSTINRELREVWEERCAVCGHTATARHDKTGIEGSHIYPVQYGGPDTIGNILPMCRNHHWAFENGWVAISDEYRVLIHPDTPASTRELLGVDAGADLYLITGYEPRREYVTLHRRIHGFDPIKRGQQFPIQLKSLTEDGASVTFPDGTTVTVPMNAMKRGVKQFFTVRVTDITENGVRAVPQQPVDAD